MKIYISGKISGTDLSETRKRFAAVAEATKRLGYEPVNPLENGLSEHDTWKAHMLKDIADLLQCKYLYATRVGRKQRRTYRALYRYQKKNAYNV